MSFTVGNSYGSTYNHDICINFSDPSFNGQYAPYKMNTVQLNIPTITGKLNGEGESVVVFPDGMRDDGTAYDKAAGKRAEVVMAEVDLGDLNWTYAANSAVFYSTQNIGQKRVAKRTSVCSKYKTIVNVSGSTNINEDKVICLGSLASEYRIYVKDSSYTDAVTFKAAMAGVKLIYERDEPLVYELDESIEKTFEVEAGGTERRLPEDAATVVNAPFYGTVQYPIALQPNDTISNDSLTALLTALKSAGKIANYTMTWDAATNSYKFTIS